MNILSKIWYYTRQCLTSGYFYAAAVPVGLLSLAYWKQNILLYINYLPQGSRGSYVYLPSRYNLPFEDVWLITKDKVKIHCWFVKQTNKNIKETPTIVYFHGNAGNISHRLVSVRELYTCVNCNVLLVSYRGYGCSEGEPTEEGLKLDAEAAIEYLKTRKDINVQNIFVFGRSLGGAVALSLIPKYQQDIRGIIIENTFTNISDMIDVLMPYLKFVKWLSRNQWRNDEMVTKMKVDKPILFLAGQKDELVPPRMMVKIYQRCTSKLKSLKLFPNGTHNETWLELGYNKVIADWVEKYKHK